jgi:hypothetical protein
MTIEAEKQEPVAWDVFNKHGRIYFAIGNQSFPVEYTPEDEPDCSAGQAAEWYMDQLRHALTRLATPQPQQAEKQETGTQAFESTCSETLRALGKPYPRTCKKCGLGPCIGKPQRQWVGLTDAEIEEFDYYARDLVMDIEKALKERNNVA